mmetsp:Transcript_59976/g.165867  ORF Transcript_59976/g.165867 Transcript_59976/m.165867 type:complete len:253 (+) Transcript_59976:88-846(+)
MRSVAIALLVGLASAAEDGAAPGLRGSLPSVVAENATQPKSENSTSIASGAEAEEMPAADMGTLLLNVSELSEGNFSGGNLSGNASELFPLLKSGRGWSQGGDKVWGAGTGIENINSGNVGYYNQGMYMARARCGGSHCALIVNPPGHRSVQVFHIHFVHYAGYGASLKHRLEGKVCRAGGWHGGGLPCGGRAAFFPGFPGIFSAAMSGGSIRGASVIAWPSSCGGRGTIVQLAFGCSIEHQIRGDYNPNHR